MKKKYLKSVIGIGVGVILLTTAVFANYESASGYTACKNALKKVAFAENFSMDYTTEVTFDDEIYGRMFGSYKLSAGNNPSLQTETTEENADGQIYYTKRTIQDEIDIFENYYPKAENTNGYIHDKYRDPTSIAAEIGNDAEVGEKIVFWVETLADALVGDLKNSFVLISKEDGISKYNISLAKDQMPSYVTAGVSLFTTAIRNNNSADINGSVMQEDPFYLMFGGDEPYVKDVTATMSVDENGNPVQAAGVVNIIGYDADGKEHVMACNISMDFYDFGKTSIERVPNETLKELEDYRNATVRKKLAEQSAEAGEEFDESSFPETGEAASVGIIGGADGPTAIYVR